MATTTYLDIIRLNEAKTYLKVDDQTITDNEIVGMINSALSYIEKSTGWVMFARDKNYFGTYYVDVFDFPINTVVVDTIEKGSYSRVPTVDGKVTLNVGIAEREELPQELINCALELISFWYYNEETKNAQNSIPDFVQANIDKNRRFI